MIALPLVAKVAIVATAGIIGGATGFKFSVTVTKNKSAKERAEEQRLRSLGLIRDTPKPKPIETKKEA